MLQLVGSNTIDVAVSPDGQISSDGSPADHGKADVGKTTGVLRTEKEAAPAAAAESRTDMEAGMNLRHRF